MADESKYELSYSAICFKTHPFAFACCRATSFRPFLPSFPSRDSINSFLVLSSHDNRRTWGHASTPDLFFMLHVCVVMLKQSWSWHTGPTRCTAGSSTAGQLASLLALVTCLSKSIIHTYFLGIIIVIKIKIAPFTFIYINFYSFLMIIPFLIKFMYPCKINGHCG